MTMLRSKQLIMLYVVRRLRWYLTDNLTDLSADIKI